MIYLFIGGNIEKFPAVGLKFFNITFEIIEKPSQYKCFPMRKQQQLGENKKIILWSIGTNYFIFIVVPRVYYMLHQKSEIRTES